MEIYNNYEVKNPIIKFLLKEFPDKVISLSVGGLVSLLDIKGFIVEIEDIMFFYGTSEETVKESINKLGFSFSLRHKEVEASFSKKNLTNEKDSKETNSKTKNLNTNDYSFLDENHPERFYAITRNIPEMKLKMMDYGINYLKPSTYYYLFKKTDEEIEHYFSKKIRRRSKVKNDKLGAIIKYNNNRSFDNLHYRMIDLEEEWKLAEEWMNFFFELGKYINNYQGELNLFISYIARTIPATITSAGIIDAFYQNITLKREMLSNVDYGFKYGDTVSYKMGNTWRKAKVIRIEEKKGMNEKYNPYLIIEVARPGQPISVESIPNNLWKNKIRFGGIVTKSSGTSSAVKINDRISDILKERYGKNTIDAIKIKPHMHVNLIGRGIDKKNKDVYQGVQFADKKGVFMFSDLLYFDKKTKTNFVNVHVINSLNSTFNTKGISVFIGAKVGLDFSEYANEKNIYFTSRIRQNYLNDTDLLLNMLRQQTKKNKNKQHAETEKIFLYLKNLNINIPKGVEIYAF